VDQIATALAEAVEVALPAWVERSVEQVLIAQRGHADAAVMARATAAGRQAAATIGPDLRQALAADVDAARINPMAVIRRAVRYPTEILREARAVPVLRDAFQQRQFPDDDYDLTPASWADLGPEVAELGITWGAARAHAHLSRHGGNRS
jgi:hypothetical protein